MVQNCNAIFILVYKYAVLQTFEECIKLTAASKMLDPFGEADAKSTTFITNTSCLNK